MFFLTPLLIIFSGLVSFPNRLTLFFDPPSPPARLGGTGSFGPTTRNGQAQKQGWLLEGCHVLDRHWQKKMLRKPGASPFQSSVSFFFKPGASLLQRLPFPPGLSSRWPLREGNPPARARGRRCALPRTPPPFLWGCQGSVEGLLINFPFSHTSLFQPWASPFEPSVSFNNALRGCDGLRRLVRGHPSREKGLKGL